MSASKFKNMRHIEAVRNYLNACIHELSERGEYHDQSKLEEPEVSYFEEYTSKLADMTYGSEEYFDCLKAMKPAIDHHYQVNSHHPEFYPGSIHDMNLFDLLEMLCDWKASGMRMEGGDLMKSININTKRFSISEDLQKILNNTAKWIESQEVFHKADES